MAGRHKGWRGRWQVDLTAGTATHDTGLVVYFGAALDGGVPFGAGAVLPDNVAAVRVELEAKNGLHNTPQMLNRLAREAAEIWGEKNGYPNA
ncbi:MAG: hypothetical protein LBE32_00575 [Burkholderiales bacterium]|nr:hypothetical protein [Burkholderiales bacterium]